MFLDVWSKGTKHFLPLSTELSHHGVETLLVHTGSWGPEPKAHAEEIIDGLTCRDIKYYKTRFIYKMLQMERPEVVLMINNTLIGDRVRILAARSLGIKSAFLMGGIRFDDMRDGLFFTTFLKRLRWKRIIKYLQYTIPNYYYSGFKNDRWFPFRPNLYRVIYNTFCCPEIMTTCPPPSDELRCDKALVFANAYYKSLTDYGYYPAHRIEVVGHPPLDDVFDLKNKPPSNEQRTVFLSSVRVPTSENYIVYVEGSFVENEVDGWSEKSRLLHLEEIANICVQTRKMLVVKLHPFTNSQYIMKSSLSNRSNVKLIENCDLPLLFYFSTAVIGHSSTALVIPIILEKPVLVPAWGISENTPYQIFNCQSVVTRCNSPREMIAHLLDPGKATAANQKALSEFVEQYITKTDGCAVKRIAASLMSLGKTK